MDFVGLIIGVLFSAAGGEFFVRGTVGMATWARIPAGIIGATVAAFATSSPELSVSINSALSKNPQIALGDALGSNIVNIGLVLGITLLAGSIKVARDTMFRDIPTAALTPILAFLLLLDGKLSRTDGIILISIFIIWLIVTAIEAKKQRSAMEEVIGEHNVVAAIGYSSVGLALLITAGRMIVIAAKNIAAQNNWDPYIVGATLVAVGTSTPEIATVIIAQLRGHQEISLGTIFGSNIFNGLLIVGTASSIFPIVISINNISIGLGFGMLVVLLAVPLKNRTLGRSRGIIFLGIYAVYIILTLLFRPAQ